MSGTRNHTGRKDEDISDRDDEEIDDDPLPDEIAFPAEGEDDEDKPPTLFLNFKTSVR